MTTIIPGKLRIVFLSDFESAGGAAIAATRLVDALHQLGNEIIRLVHAPDDRERPWRVESLSSRSPQPIAARVFNRLIGVRLQSSLRDRRVASELSAVLSELKPDVINVHNLHSAGWSPALVEICLRYAPTVWTLHDMWSFTGRCTYSYDCRKFITGCNAECPTATEYPSLSANRIEPEWISRNRIFREHPGLVAVVPSRWLESEATAGLWRGHRVERIPYGLPLHIYRPESREFARKALDIHVDGPVILAAAQDFGERRKGGATLAEALHLVQHRPLTVLTLGRGTIALDTEGADVRSLGHIDLERARVLAYNAADLFVHPAPVDNLPNVVLEAIACGTPVVAFPIGGIPDMVRPNHTGWLTDEVSARGLAATLDRALFDLRTGIDLRVACRSTAEAEYSAELQVSRYVELFQSLAASRSSLAPSVSGLVSNPD